MEKFSQNKKFHTLLKRAIKLHKSGKFREAEAILNGILPTLPDDFEILYILGNIFFDMGQYEKAKHYYRETIRLNPEFAGSYYNLGSLFHEGEQFDEAIAYYQKALELDPTCVDILNSIGVILHKKGEFDEAIRYFQRASVLNPGFSKTFFNLGNTLNQKMRFEEAVFFYQKAIAIDTNYAGAYLNLGNVLQEQGKLAEAEESYRRSLQVDPDSSACYSNLLFHMQYDTRADRQAILSEHLQFAQRFKEPVRAKIHDHPNDKDMNRRLRIGYVSPDFRRHSVAYFIEPVLAAREKRHCEVFCYSDVRSPDEVTERIRRISDHWRYIAGKRDELVAELIQNDGIDILVDLAGHTSHNRLLLFARKPAPVQVSWIGYPATTGLSAMDYKIVDSYTDPPGMTEQLYTEELIRMPESFLCYLPEKDSPEVGPLPALTSEHITFGSLNKFAKVTAYSIHLWADILEAIPDAHLLLKAKSFSESSTRKHVMDFFSRKGILAERIHLVPWEPSTSAHLETYKSIDIGLDTFPYNGTTTTCEALWMGVPVITLAGHSHASRVGASTLSNIGLTDCIANTPDQYRDIAIHLAGDLQRLQALREGLRDRMAHSLLTDAKRFVANLENCYRVIWERWCMAGDEKEI